jgi:hypothetical protein
VGEDLPTVADTDLVKMDKTVTLRFINIGTDPSENDHYYVHSSSSTEKESYILEQNSFNKIEFVTLPYETVIVKNETALTKLLSDTKPSFESDYFVEILIYYPNYVHGAGFGMYGVMINILTLGIFPAYWVNDVKYQINIFARNKEYKSFELQEKYHEFSSIFFNLVPGSDRKGKLYKLGSIDKNALKTILVNIQKMITNDKIIN